MKTVVIIALLALAVAVSARPGRDRGKPDNHPREPKPCRDEYTNGTMIRERDCPGPFKCTKGPKDDQLPDGTPIKTYFCDMPSKHNGKDKHSKRDRKDKSKPCREERTDGTVISEQDCPGPIKCTKGPKDDELEDGTPIKTYFCDMPGRRNGKDKHSKSDRSRHVRSVDSQDSTDSKESEDSTGSKDSEESKSKSSDSKSNDDDSD